MKYDPQNWSLLNYGFLNGTNDVNLPNNKNTPYLIGIDASIPAIQIVNTLTGDVVENFLLNPGNSAQILFKTLVIPSAQVLQLNTTPLDIIPAPTVLGKQIVTFGAWATINFNSAQYKSNVDLWLITDTADKPQINFEGNILGLVGFLPSTVTRSLSGILTLDANSSNSPYSDATSNQLIPNKSLKVFVPGGNPTNGDSDIIINVAYMIQ